MMEAEKKRTVLIVEDEPLNKRMIQALVSIVGGYNVLEATDGVEVIRIAKEQKPDLILMDIRLAKATMGGEEAIRVLKADTSTKDIPIITITAYAMPSERERFLEAGSDAYISKPFRSEQLFAEIKRFMGA